MKATLKNNSITYIEWKGNNLKEVRDFISPLGEAYLSPIINNGLYISFVGTISKGDYIFKLNCYDKSPYMTCPSEIFTQIINENL